MDIELILLPLLILKCYGPYKRDSTDGQRGLRPTQDQYARGGTDGTSGTMGRGVAESHDRTQYMSLGTKERRVPTYSRTKPFTIGRSYIFKNRSPYL